MRRPTNGLSLHDVAERAAQIDGRRVQYMYHAAIVAARELGIYERGRGYTDKECRSMCAVIAHLFPPRGTD